MGPPEEQVLSVDQSHLGSPFNKCYVSVKSQHQLRIKGTKSHWNGENLQSHEHLQDSAANLTMPSPNTDNTRTCPLARIQYQMG